MSKTPNWWQLSPRRYLIKAETRISVALAQLLLRRKAGTAWLVSTETSTMAPSRLVVTLAHRVHQELPKTGDRCLVRAAAIRVLLARRAYSHPIQLGTRVTSAGLEAHAWIEDAGGQVLVGSLPDLASFQRLSR
mgnify:CR=1 FL=1